MLIHMLIYKHGLRIDSPFNYDQCDASAIKTQETQGETTTGSHQPGGHKKRRVTEKAGETETDSRNEISLNKDMVSECVRKWMYI